MTVLVVVFAVLGVLIVVTVLVATLERIVPTSVLRAYWRVTNPLFKASAGFLPGWAVIETTGRKTGLPRQVPVGGRLRGSTYWLVAGHGRTCDYVRNIERDERVRVRVHGRWRTGIARLIPDDDPRKRLLRINPLNSAFLLVAGKDPVTVRIDLEHAR